MSLEAAIDAHNKGDVSEAARLYQKYLDQTPEPSPIAYQNLGAIYRSKGNPEKAVNTLKHALTKHPNNAPILNNLGNAYLDLGKTYEAIQVLLLALRIQPNFIDARLTCAVALRSNGYNNLSYALLKHGYYISSSDDEKSRLEFPVIDAAIGVEAIASTVSCKFLLQRYTECKLQNQLEGCIRYGLSILQIKTIDSPEDAFSWQKEFSEDLSTLLSKTNLGLKKGFFKQWATVTWNLSIKLLNSGNLKKGWSLYDSGLQVKASGPQKWQRSLRKPYSSTQVPVWSGSVTSSKQLLVLGEQGIGDTMMFATLLPVLSNKGHNIVFHPGDRLFSIYKRSFEKYNITTCLSSDFAKIYSSDSFDSQIPIGSIPSFGFDELSDYGTHAACLISHSKTTSLLRKDYKSRSAGRTLIGLSWKGGGKGKRITHKSINLLKLLPLLKSDHFSFVSLQYGDVESEIDTINEITSSTVIYDKRINSLKNMDSWLSQVAACDAVISIANTTIHASVGLAVPTLCLLGDSPDWRWDITSTPPHNIFYPNLDVIYKNQYPDWDDINSPIMDWLSQNVKS